MAHNLFSRRLQSLLQRSFQDSSHSKESTEETSSSRREFLKNAGLATSTLALSPLMGIPYAHAHRKNDSPVAIVGAGAAGLTAAYQLKKFGIPFVLYEASSRVGGRIYTDEHSFSSHGQFCELGGELVNSSHTSLRSLARELGLPLEDFPTGDVGLQHDIFLYRGQHYSEKEILEAARPLMKILHADLAKIFGKEDSEIIYVGSPFAANAKKYDQISLAEYLDSISDLEHWFKEILIIAYGTENGISPANQSVLTFFSYFGESPNEKFSLYGSSDELSRIKGGNSKLMDATLKALGPNADMKFHHQLLRVSEEGTKLKLDFHTPGGTKTISHEQVILAMPYTVLRTVEGFKDGKLDLKPALLKSIQQMQYGQNSKTMMGFKERVWRFPKTGKGSTGSAVTDLSASVIWETSRLQKGPQGIITWFAGGKAAVETDPSKVPQILSDIDTVFPGTKVEHNHKIAQFNWSKNPWALCSYSGPSPGQYTTLMGLSHEPQLNGRLMFIGEHTSIMNFGYMEGAVESGFRAAKQVARSRSVKASS